MAATLSPPPIREYAPWLVACAMAKAICLVPFSNFSISNTPIGPFHSMVWDLPIISLNMPMAFPPMSSPIQPSGIWSLGQSLVCASAANLSAIILVSGRCILTLFCLAFSNKLRATSYLSASHREAPILPPRAFKKVYAIPPPMIISVALFNKFSIINILSDTLAPPIMAVNGFLKLFITCSALCSSASINKPYILLALVKYCAIIVVDA